MGKAQAPRREEKHQKGKKKIVMFARDVGREWEGRGRKGEDGVSCVCVGDR